MQEQILMYGVCAAITIAAVAITSFFKIIVCAIAKRCGRSLSGNVKEYIFTPVALLLAAGALYVWLEHYIHVEDEQLFILIIVCFSVGTMLIYWLLFQPTRKAAKGVIRTIAHCFNVEPAIDAVQEVMSASHAGEEQEEPTQPNLQSNAEKAGDSSQINASDSTERDSPKTIDSEADKLRAMVEAIKKK